jgi:RNA polymerase sigma factor (sigma-70 family)
VVLLMGAVRAVVAAVLRLGQEDPDVQDCTSETLRRAMEGRSRLRVGEQMRPWVLGIARHVALDMLRARKRHGEVPDVIYTNDGDEGISRTDAIPDPAAGPDELLEQARRRKQIQSAMSTLPEPMAMALMKFHLDGRSYQEIAEEMKVPLGTVATWVTRGRKTLAEKLGQKGALLA